MQGKLRSKYYFSALLVVIILFSFSALGSAAVTGFVAEGDDGKYYEYMYEDLLESYILSLLGQRAELYEDFSEKELKAFWEDNHGYIKYEDALEKYVISIIDGEPFNFDTYTSSGTAEAAVMPDVIYVVSVNKRGRLIETAKLIDDKQEPEKSAESQDTDIGEPAEPEESKESEEAGEPEGPQESQGPDELQENQEPEEPLDTDTDESMEPEEPQETEEAEETEGLEDAREPEEPQEDEEAEETEGLEDALEPEELREAEDSQEPGELHEPEELEAPQEAGAPPDPPANRTCTHQVINGVLYGLDYWGSRTRITGAPEFIPAGNYIVDKQYNFFLITPSEPAYKGNFYYPGHVPYLLMPLNRTDPRITASLLEFEAKKRRGSTSFVGETASAFVEAQNTWGINGLFLMALAAVESNWGTSDIARDKNNIFGYMAYDSNPYATAAAFHSLEECILFVSGFIRGTYLTEGDWRNKGENLLGMNHYYAKDPMWSMKIANLMQSILPYEEIQDTEQPSNQGRVNVSTSLNLRSGAGTTHPVIGSLTGGMELDIIGMKVIDDCCWFKVETDGKVGWVCGKYIELLTNPRGIVYLSASRTNEDVTLIVHAGPGAEQAVTGSLDYRAEFTVKAVMAINQTPWYHIDFDSGDGWVDGSHVTIDW